MTLRSYDKRTDEELIRSITVPAEWKKRMDDDVEEEPVIVQHLRDEMAMNHVLREQNQLLRELLVPEVYAQFTARCVAQGIPYDCPRPSVMG